MNRIKKALIWYLMFSKRLFHKVSFVVLLCLIPAIIPLMNNVLSEDAGVLRIALCAQDNDPVSQSAIQQLTESDGFIHYTVYNSESEAIDAVTNFKADAAWIYEDNLSQKIDQYARYEFSGPLIRVVQREETVPLQISREILHGSIYKDMAYSIYGDFVKNTALKGTDVSDEELMEYYTSTQRLGDIIETTRLNADAPQIKTNYLTAPLRGILALLILLCTLASALYFLKDRQEGKFDWITPGRRIVPAFASCLSASVFSGIAVFLSLQIAGLTVGFSRDLLGILLYVLCTTGFCLNLCILFRSPGKLGAMIPGIIIISMILSPIFFNGHDFMVLRLCLPSYTYLLSTYNSDYFIYMAYYCLGAYTLAFILNFILNNIPLFAKHRV